VLPVPSVTVMVFADAAPVANATARHPKNVLFIVFGL
jgi:hypothetical protein